MVEAPWLRRRFLASALAGALLRGQERTTATGVTATQVGDVAPGRAVLWARSDRASRMIVTWRTSERGEARRVTGPHCLDVTDFTGRVSLTGLPPGQTVLYTVEFEDLASGRRRGEPLAGQFRTAPAAGEGIRFLWSGDTCGQGWGINPEWGGMRIYETMRSREPHFFIHSGDNIYADSPLPGEIRLPQGGVWRNVVTEEKSKVAETLEEFRGNYRYNLMDVHLKRFSSEVAQIWQWDDHEFTNNWSPSKSLWDDARYREKSVPLLRARATRAFLEYAPMAWHPDEPERVYRHIHYGPLLDVFVIDMRSYRGPNTWNRQPAESDETALLGATQLAWLKRALRSSRAVWKVIASDMPIGLRVGDGKDEQDRPRFEAVANGEGPPLGRELEIASLLRDLKQNRVRNTVWLTADVHYTAAHFYDPAQARFTEFLPFWEFVSGPLHAGTFGPGEPDDTFGIQVRYQKVPREQNAPPSAGLQFFGEVEIEARSRALTVTLRDLGGGALFRQQLLPEPA